MTWWVRARTFEGELVGNLVDLWSDALNAARPKGENVPPNSIGNAVMIAKIATGEIENTPGTARMPLMSREAKRNCSESY